MKPVFKVLDDDGDEVELPARFEVCSRCRGEGVHDNAAFSNGISLEDFAEDPEFKEDYLSGAYDVTCSECNGLRVVPIPDENALSEEQKRWLKNWQEAEADKRAEQRMRERGIQF